MSNPFLRMRSAQQAATQRAAIQRVTIRERIEQLSESIPDGATWRNLPRFPVGDKVYIANTWLDTQTDSIILKYGDYIVPINHVNTNGERVEKLGGKVWICNLCDQQGRIKIFDGKATTAPRNHIISKARSGHGKALLASSRDSSSAPDSRQGSMGPDTILQQLVGRATRETPVRNTATNYKRLLIELLTTCDIATNTCTREQFRKFLVFHNKDLVDTLLPASGSTVLAWVYDAFAKGRAAIAEQLRGSRSKIHLSFDMWTSPNCNGIVAVVAHYVDESWKLRTRLLALRRVAGVHKAENMLYHLVDVINNYGISDKLGFYMTDNHGVNDKAVRLLFQHYGDNVSDESAFALASQYRMRCIGHILNIIAGHFIYKKSDEGKGRSMGITAIDKAHNICNYIRWTPQRRSAFRQEVKKVKLMGNITATDRDVDEFIDELDDDIDDELDTDYRATIPGADKPIWDLDEEEPEPYGEEMVAVGNSTRWNGIYTDTVCNTLSLKEAINAFIDTYRRRGISGDRIPQQHDISEEDWACLEEIRGILETFDELTLFHEGNNVNICNVMACIKELEDHLRKYLARYDLVDEETEIEENPPFEPPSQSQYHSQRSIRTPSQRLKRRAQPIATSDEDCFHINTRKRRRLNNDQKARVHHLGEQGYREIREALIRTYESLQKYRRLLNEAPAYWSAVVLHPGKRLIGLRRSDSSLAIKVERMVTQYWRDNYAPVSPSPPLNDSITVLGDESQQRTAIPIRRRRRGPRPPKGTAYDASDSQEPVDELQRYLDLETASFTMGGDPLKWWRDRQHEYPTLHRFAVDILSIPAMSAECERVFSQAKLTMSCQRQKMKTRTLEAIQCLKHWLLDDPDELHELTRPTVAVGGDAGSDDEVDEVVGGGVTGVL